MGECVLTMGWVMGVRGGYNEFPCNGKSKQMKCEMHATYNTSNSWRFPNSVGTVPVKAFVYICLQIYIT